MFSNYWRVPVSRKRWEGGNRGLKAEITEKEKAAIEQGLSSRGVSEVLIKIENGKVVVLQVEKKKIV